MNFFRPKFVHIENKFGTNMKDWKEKKFLLFICHGHKTSEKKLFEENKKFNRKDSHASLSNENEMCVRNQKNEKSFQ